MGMPFNADEVFEMAERIERNGAKFYRAAAKNFPEISEIFLDLADMEDKHLKTFAQMREELSDSESDPLVFDPYEEAQMYLQVMADGYVFDMNADLVEKLSGCKTPEDVLRMAIGIERDSIVFYVGLKESVSQRAGKDKIEAIIRQEVGHIAVLKKKLDGLQ